ncbi:MAG: response regulator [Deltaproteobacteria bacterium]|nr:response regulator [Deltaproteobacteria bacterium]MBW2106249.1 response regulator [Deltaproteobacteria bacterium]MBW2332953.1 response regulator [Deltaproteobacteria bacterium]
MDLFSKLKAMKLLLIDDDQWIRDSLSIFFEGEGCHLLVLETAEDGLEELKSQDYDIIIADYRLPGMDGLEFLKRSQEINPNAMRVLITAYGNSEIFSKAYKLGVQDCINKPFTIETIEESLLRLMEAGEKKN